MFSSNIEQRRDEAANSTFKRRAEHTRLGREVASEALCRSRRGCCCARNFFLLFFEARGLSAYTGYILETLLSKGM